MDHARLSCSAVSSIAGVPFAEFTDFQPCSVTLTSKLAGVTSASRRGREGTHQRSCWVPSALVDRRHPDSTQRAAIAVNCFSTPRRCSATANRKLRAIGSEYNHRPCRIVLCGHHCPRPGGWRLPRGGAQLAVLPLCSLVGSRGRWPGHMAPSQWRVTWPISTLTACPRMRASPVPGERHGP